MFEYNQVVRDVVDIHYPVHEMTCNSKIRYLHAKGINIYCHCISLLPRVAYLIKNIKNFRNKVFIIMWPKFGIKSQ